jgi:uncharacterized protein (TIGR02246 family)
VEKGDMNEPDDWNACARRIYASLLADWNAQDARAMASHFADRGSLIGFDGSVVEGRAAIESHIGPIFAAHPTPRFVARVRDVRRLSAQTVLLRGVAGMWPRGAGDLDSAFNAIQTVLLSFCDGAFKVELFQNTPASWHGRDADRERLSAELRALRSPAPD